MSGQSISSRQYIAHFFREIDLDSDDRIMWPEHQVRGCLTDETVLKPLYMLRHALRIGRLYATMAKRNGRSTISGDQPVVSFADFNDETLRAVCRKSKAGVRLWSPVGIVVPRDQLIARGAARVLRGISAANKGAQAFRYVDRWPDLNGPWCFENEWRWPLAEPQRSPQDWPATSFDIPGLDLDCLEGIGVIVAKQSEVRPVQFDILTKVDRGDCDRSTYQFIVPLPEVKRCLANKHDGSMVMAAIERNALDLTPYFEVPAEVARQTTRDIDELARLVVDNMPGPEQGEIGGCWLWLMDNFHPVTRALIRSGAAKVNQAGKYLVRINGWGGYCLRQREEMTVKLARRLKTEFAVRATYYSVLGKTDPDARPFFIGNVGDGLYFNH